MPGSFGHANNWLSEGVDLTVRCLQLMWIRGNKKKNNHWYSLCNSLFQDEVEINKVASDLELFIDCQLFFLGWIQIYTLSRKRKSLINNRKKEMSPYKFHERWSPCNTDGIFPTRRSSRWDAKLKEKETLPWSWTRQDKGLTNECCCTDFSFMDLKG